MKQRVDIIVIGVVDHDECTLATPSREKEIREAITEALKKVPGIRADDFEFEYGDAV